MSEGIGGILDIQGRMPGNSFTNWNKVTPRHNAFVQYMLQSDVHIIGTLRSKMDYVLVEKNGKQMPEKVGLKGIQREGLDYEFTIALELDLTRHARASKDRTRLFTGQPDFIPSIETGRHILSWCEQGTDTFSITSKDDMLKAIRDSQTIDDLLLLHSTYPAYQEEMLTEFTRRRQEIMLDPINNQSTTLLTNQNHHQNGTAYRS